MFNKYGYLNIHNILIRCSSNDIVEPKSYLHKKTKSKSSEYVKIDKAKDMNKIQKFEDGIAFAKKIAAIKDITVSDAIQKYTPSSYDAVETAVNWGSKKVARYLDLIDNEDLDNYEAFYVVEYFKGVQPKD